MSMRTSHVHYAVDNTAPASLALGQADTDLPRLAIKHDALFLLTDTSGLMPSDVSAGFGLFRDDTRWLSQWEVRIGGQPLMLLNANTSDGFAANFVYGNRASRYLPKMSIQVERDIVLNEGLTERIVVRNFTGSLARITLTIEFANDFADMFEVRGDKRKKRGLHMVPQASLCRRRVALAYEGLDGVLRETVIDFLKTRPKSLSGRQATYELYMDPGTERELLCHVRTRTDGTHQPPLAPPSVSFEQERMIAAARFIGWDEHKAKISTSDLRFNGILNQAVTDLYTLRTTMDGGTALAAGVPWFVAPFGRDDFIAALQTVAFMPDLSRDILRFFAAWQGTKHDEEVAEAPGKMPHEIRVGEMAKMEEIAFRPYYGTVDATQLWLMLLREYVRWTGDLELVRELWENAEAADDFLSESTNNGHQFITYGGTGALTNQGWKDSGNCIRYSNGEQATGPIAVCEAQGYLYAAWDGLSELATMLGDELYSQQLRLKAACLRDNFNRQFAMGDFYALALDGKGKQCDVVSSNPGHLLGTGIVSREREQAIVDRLMQEDMFSGWGIRTLASSEAAYQPMDYQLGSVWPHDTAYSASKFASVGRANEADRVLRAQFDAALALAECNRLPELFCGFARSGKHAPVRYPVACVPQAWSSGAWLQMLYGLLNVRADAVNNRIDFGRSMIPGWLGTVRIEGWRIGDSILNVEFRGAEIHVVDIVGDVQISVEGQ